MPWTPSRNHGDRNTSASDVEGPETNRVGEYPRHDYDEAAGSWVCVSSDQGGQ